MTFPPSSGNWPIYGSVLKQLSFLVSGQFTLFWRELWYVANYAFFVLFLKSKTCVCAILLRFSISVLLMLPDNYCETGQHSQFLQCFKDCETSPMLNTQHHTLGILMEQINLKRKKTISTLLIWGIPPKMFSKKKGIEDWVWRLVLNYGQQEIYMDTCLLNSRLRAPIV